MDEYKLSDSEIRSIIKNLFNLLEMPENMRDNILKKILCNFK